MITACYFIYMYRWVLLCVAFVVEKLFIILIFHEVFTHVSILTDVVIHWKVIHDFSFLPNRAVSFFPLTYPLGSGWPLFSAQVASGIGYFYNIKILIADKLSDTHGFPRFVSDPCHRFSVPGFHGGLGSKSTPIFQWSSVQSHAFILSCSYSSTCSAYLRFGLGSRLNFCYRYYQEQSGE